MRRLTVILFALWAALALFAGDVRAEDRVAVVTGITSDVAPANPSSLSRITVLPPPGSKEPSREIKVLPAPDCSAGQRKQDGRCVALPAPAKPQFKKEAARPEPKARERVEKPRERIRAREENFSRRPVVSRTACPAGSSPMSQGGRTCCETTPERGAPRIFCL